MKKIAFFCIPAHGHTNPMLPVASELVKCGNKVRFYSFNEFEAKIKATGAEFISCDSFLPELTEQEKTGLKNISTTEMTIQDIRITLGMNDFLDREFREFCPDVVYTDSVCFWGKLNAWKHDVPMVVSTSTFAFNQMSSQYMKNSPQELADLIFGLPRVSRELNKLKAYGFKFKGLFSLIQSDNDTDSVVYTSKRFQPYSESFSSHYLFAGPSVFSEHKPKKNEKPLVYVSMGTVINDRPDFYSKCINAIRGENVDLVISCGNAVEITSLGELPENVKVFPYVNQMDILSKASVFITHCGMNSVSESLYMETPMVLYPQTNEQAAVARRVTEIGAGMMLTDDSVEVIRKAVRNVLQTESYAKAAQECAEDFRSSPGIVGTAEFVENAPHGSSGIDVMKKLAKANALAQVIYNIISVLLAVFIFHFVNPKFIWIVVFIGKGLFSKELEEMLVGIEKDREFTFAVGCDIVKATAIKITRTVLASLSEYELKAVRRQSIDRQLDMFFDENEDVDRASAMLCTQAAEKSGFELEREELSLVEASIKTQVSGNDELSQFMKTVFVNTFKNALLGQSLCENEGTLLTQADYEDIIRRDLEANPKMTAEEAKAAYPVFEFMKTRYADRYIKMIDKYIADEFKKVLNKEVL